ncbi:MAG: DNA-processing protein DprA [Desulfohalobiaceae bacterium]|nr:DNA-processing protein DprA [Desulfohalobiaceae bacterium]
MFSEEIRQTAAQCRHYAMCKIDFLDTGICASGRENHYVSHFPQGRMLEKGRDLFYVSANMTSDDFRQELWACLALQQTDGLGLRTAKQLLEHYGSARAALKDASGWPGKNLVRTKVADLVLREAYKAAASAEWDLIQKHNHGILLFCDPLYPERLRQIPDPPLFLYYQGRPEILQQPCLAMVGSRSCSKYGLQAASEIALDLSREGLGVVSGFALGIDRQSHISAMKGRGRSIAVLGTGVDILYPVRNRDLRETMSRSGLLLTEFPPGTPPDPHNFPRRNRIISGLGLGVLVIEAAEKSGSLITARLALEQDREVFAIPGPLHLPTYYGCHSLIRQGALLIRNAADILQELSPVLHHEWPLSGPGKENRSQKELPLDLSPDEASLARILEKHSQLHIDRLSQLLGWQSNLVSQTLLMLELKGLVKRKTGMYYSLK